MCRLPSPFLGRHLRRILFPASKGSQGLGSSQETQMVCRPAVCYLGVASGLTTSRKLVHVKSSLRRFDPHSPGKLLLRQSTTMLSPEQKMAKKKAITSHSTNR